MSRRRLMSRAEFETFAVERRGSSPLTGLSLRKGLIVVRSPYELQPCTCGDVNCHGWRIVEQKNGAVDLRAVGDGELLYGS